MKSYVFSPRDTIRKEKTVNWGRINSIQPEELFSPKMGFLTSTMEDAQHYANIVFERIDEDCNGLITKKEMERYLKWVLSEIKPNHVWDSKAFDSGWKILDADRDGYINRQELLKITLSQMKRYNLLDCSPSVLKKTPLVNFTVATASDDSFSSSAETE